VKTNQSKIKAVALIGLCASLALLLSYVEHLLPPLFVAVPGIKMGLPNVVILYVLYCMGVKRAALVSFVRIFLTTMLFGNTMTLAYSVAGALLSLLVMAILKRINFLSPLGVSVAGGICHNIGQVMVAVVLLDTPKIAYYLLILAVTGIISGAFIGLCSAYLIHRIPYAKIVK
jgi:heptaprenyl diphosphate synthase